MELITAQDGRLGIVEDHLIRPEFEQAQVISEAKSAATIIASAVVSGAVTRVTRAEEGICRRSGRNGSVARFGDGEPDHVTQSRAASFGGLRPTLTCTVCIHPF